MCSFYRPVMDIGHICWLGDRWDLLNIAYEYQKVFHSFFFSMNLTLYSGIRNFWFRFASFHFESICTTYDYLLNPLSNDLTCRYRYKHAHNEWFKRLTIWLIQLNSWLLLNRWRHFDCLLTISRNKSFRKQSDTILLHIWLIERY